MMQNTDGAVNLSAYNDTAASLADGERGGLCDATGCAGLAPARRFREGTLPASVVRLSQPPDAILGATLHSHVDDAQSYTQALAGGVDEVNYDSLTVKEIRQEWTTARRQAGDKYIIKAGCSVPNTSTPAALAPLRESVNA